MFATIEATGQTFPIDTFTVGGVYLRIMGWPRFFAAHLVTVAG